jgi:hypothetical protein
MVNGNWLVVTVREQGSDLSMEEGRTETCVDTVESNV